MGPGRPRAHARDRLTGRQLQPFRVSVVIPAFNEEADIAGCVRCLGQQTMALETVEVLLVDGRSEDATVAEATAEAVHYPFGAFRVLHNAARQTSAGLNLGLAAATGQVLARVDARSRISPHYLERAVAALERDPTIGAVGGRQTTVARSQDWRARGMARGMRNRVSTGLSRYRLSRRSGPSDTVWMGCFRTNQLRQLGGWDERLAVNEDFDLNERYRRAGYTVWFDAELEARYLPRPTLDRIARQYARYGWWKGTLWADGQAMALRHVVIMATPLAAGASTIAVGRRWGWWRAALAAIAVAGAVDHLGSDEPAGFSERAMATATISVYCGAWWAGALGGWLRTTFGRR